MVSDLQVSLLPVKDVTWVILGNYGILWNHSNKQALQVLIFDTGGLVSSPCS